MLTAFTGSSVYGGWVSFAPGSSTVEGTCAAPVPPNAVALSWATFQDAANEAAISRQYGGIHFLEGDASARDLGTNVGNQAYFKALTYFNGVATPRAL